MPNGIAEIDGRDLLGKVTIPTMVLRARDDAVIPFSAGRALATSIPSAEFVTLESRNHLLLESDLACALWTASENSWTETGGSGGDAVELLELADGALDAVLQSVDCGLEGMSAWCAGVPGDDRFGAGRFDVVEDDVSVIGLVGDDVTGIEIGEKRERLAVVADVAGGEDEAYRAAQRVDRDVPFAGQSASGAPQSLVADPPFWPVAAWAWARTIVFSPVV